MATPFEPWTGRADCWADCSEDGPDGYMGLSLQFKSQDIVDAVAPVEDGSGIVLSLTGNLLDGSAIAGVDVVRFLAKK